VEAQNSAANAKERLMSPTPIILHPTDFSEPAGRAFQLAASLARSQRAQLLVLHVPEPEALEFRPQPGAPPVEQIAQRLERLRSEAPGAAVELRIIPGDPVEEILKTARETGCALIVMGTLGLTGLARLLLGSVAEQVVRKAPCPVMTVKAPAAAAPVRTILYPTDFSKPCEEAFRVACDLAKDSSARLLVLHVAIPPAIAPTHMPMPVPLPEDHQEKLTELLHRLQASAPDVRMDCRVAKGDAAAGILDAAQDTPCELLVMGTHGRTGLGRAFMGSVAEQVLRTAPCPVITVRATAGA
jgi:nucleotide-binding universal stress UspA family protein